MPPHAQATQARVYYLTHPQVRMEPGVPVSHWGLSVVGRARAGLVARAPWSRRLGRIVVSTETKALETAAIIAAVRGLPLEVRALMHENDRSVTGYLATHEFEAVAERFFAEPQVSARGWERAVDAQTRIVAEVAAVLGAGAASAVLPGSAPDILIVGHGAVGTLLLCHLLGAPIDRRHDQPPGGGGVFAFIAATRRVVHAWRPLEATDIGDIT